LIMEKKPSTAGNSSREFILQAEGSVRGVSIVAMAPTLLSSGSYFQGKSITWGPENLILIS
ncbi:MAG: hypothetical protein ACHQEM_09855, partial [Chitinophagales bacterium]